MKKGSVISTILGCIVGAIGGMLVANNIRGKDTEKWKTMSDKHLVLFMLMNEWLKMKQEGKEIQKYFEKKKYKTVAIYGMSYVGERLLDELTACGIDVQYAIDQNAETMYSDITILSPDDKLPEVDVVVVSAIYYFDDIIEKIGNKVKCPIVSLKDVLYEVQ